VESPPLNALDAALTNDLGLRNISEIRVIVLEALLDRARTESAD